MKLAILQKFTSELLILALKAIVVTLIIALGFAVFHHLHLPDWTIGFIFIPAEAAFCWLSGQPFVLRWRIVVLLLLAGLVTQLGKAWLPRESLFAVCFIGAVLLLGPRGRSKTKAEA